MKRIAASLVATLLALALAGCVQPTTPQQTAQIKSLAIVTGFGETISFEFVGFTIFTSNSYEAPVDWNIDGHFKQRLAAELAGRYELRNAAYQPAQLKQQRRELFGPDPAVAAVRSVVRAGVADAILYIGPAEYEDTLGHSSRYISGLGLYGRSRLGFGQIHSYVFAAWRAVLFDGTTLQPIGQAAAHYTYGLENIFALKSRIPHADIEIAVPDRYDNLTGGQRTRIKDKIFQLVTETMPQVLTDLALK